MVKKRWVFGEVNREQQAPLARSLSLSPVTASLLLAPGVGTVEQARAWLSPHPTALHDPFLLPDMEKAIERLHRALAASQRIRFYGDYAVDGIADIST